ncbi:hypothetical protein DMENIID0001_157040 [Sergentomyia squamirostris]
MDRTHHSEPVDCHICGKTLKSNYNLREHIKSVHELKQYACGICNKAFAFANRLKKHLKVHSDERPFECHLCPDDDPDTEDNSRMQKHYKSEADLRNHIREILIFEDTFRTFTQVNALVLTVEQFSLGSFI